MTNRERAEQLAEGAFTGWTSEKAADEIASALDAAEQRGAARGTRDEDLRDALEDMVLQFGYGAVKDGQPAIGTGGMSALEVAFDALGWTDDPHIIENPVWCDAPVEPRCPRAIVCGMPTSEGYRHFCAKHIPSPPQAASSTEEGNSQQSETKPKE